MRGPGLANVTAATRAETSVVYAAGAVRGIVLVTFPAASTIFTDPTIYGVTRGTGLEQTELRKLNRPVRETGPVTRTRTDG